MDDILGTALQILGVIVLLAAAFLQRRSASTLRDVKDTTPQLLEQLATYLQATPSSSAADQARIDELERVVAHQRRMIDDLDESTSRRFKRLQARARRDEPEDDDEAEPAPPPPRDFRQQAFPFMTSPPASPADSGPPPNAMPRLERIGR